MTTTAKLTVEQLMAACQSELGYTDGCTCVCSPQWHITLEAENNGADGNPALLEKALTAQDAFRAFLMKYGIDVQKLVEQTRCRPYGHFHLSGDGKRLTLGNGTGCLTLQELCQMLMSARST